MNSTIWHFGKGKTVETVKISSCQGLVGRERWKGWEQGILRPWNYSVWDYNGRYMSLYICQNPEDIVHTTPRVNSNVIYGLWVIRMYQCWFTQLWKCITLVADADSGEAVYVGGRDIWEPYFHSIFCDSKTALKNKVWCI